MRATDKTNLPPNRRACSNCGRLGHQARTCQRPGKAHDMIGIEVEGWWMHNNYRSVVRYAEDSCHMAHTDDGSLVSDSSGETIPHEFKTRPGSLCEAITQVTKIYPDKTDPSAGMHIHMSFQRPLDIGILNTTQFLDYFRQRWTEWGTRLAVHRDSEFWKRLKGENNYCAVPYVATSFNGGDRYRQINWAAYAAHGTIEMRMLPLFRDARIAVSAIEEWVAIVEDYIEQHADAFWSQLDREGEIALAPAQRVVLDEFEICPEAAAELNRELELDLSVIWDNSRHMYRPAYRTVECRPDFEPLNRTWTPEVRILAEIPPPTPGHRRLWVGNHSNLYRHLSALTSE
jgi:hypothetical protein